MIFTIYNYISDYSVSVNMEFAHFVAKALIVIFCVMHESSQKDVSLFKRNKIITWSFVLNLIPSYIFWNI